MATKKKEIEVYEPVSKERRARDFDTLLAEEKDFLGTAQSYVILRKTQNSRIDPKTISRQRRQGKNVNVDIPTNDKPYVMKLVNAGTTSEMIRKMEAKGWPIVAHHFTEQTLKEAAADDRVGKIVQHVQAVQAYEDIYSKKDTGIKSKAKAKA